MNILLWHVHGSWTTAFVSGRHTYYVPVLPDRGPDGRGRARTYRWPDSVVELSPQQLRGLAVDLIILQRPHEWDLAATWLGWSPGQDIPVVYVEHNTPRGDVPNTRHPCADRTDLLLVHVTHFNDLMWDSGQTATAVIEHGIPDPGCQYTGRLDRLGAVINEPVRRGRVAGTDLLPRFADVAPVDVFGMGVNGLSGRLGARVGEFDDPSQGVMHHELAQRRAYLHTMRWTSLGLSLLEAMFLGMPVIALAATEAVRAVPAGAGVVSADVSELVDAARWLLDEPDQARAMGVRAREAVQTRYGLTRFLSDWDRLLEEVTECG
jgi:hypothetical protein